MWSTKVVIAGKRANKQIAMVTATYVDGDFNFTTAKRVEVDDESELAKFKAAAIAEMEKQREEALATIDIETKLNDFMNAA